MPDMMRKVSAFALFLFILFSAPTYTQAISSALSPASASLSLPNNGSGSFAFTQSGIPNASWPAHVIAPSGMTASASPSSGTLPSSGLSTLTVNVSNATQSGMMTLIVLHYAQVITAHLAVAGQRVAWTWHEELADPAP